MSTAHSSDAGGSLSDPCQSHASHVVASEPDELPVVLIRGTHPEERSTAPQPRSAASIAPMSIFVISIIASNARLAAAGSRPAMALVRTTGVICHDTPHLSLHQPQALS